MSLATELDQLKKRRDAGAITPEEFDRAKNKLLDDCVRHIEAFCERKPAAYVRWGIPQVNVVRGPVQVLRPMPRVANEQHAVTLEVRGRQIEIASKNPISIDPGDRVILAGYERNGRLQALAYHNESKGVYSDLRRLQRGYRLLSTFGKLSVLAGLIAVGGTEAVLIFRHRAGFGSEVWQYVPYLLSGAASASIFYFGIGISFLAARAKEFHDAMTGSWPALR